MTVSGRSVPQFESRDVQGDTGDDRRRTVDWLMEGDPAIRWQVMRDLIGASEADVLDERQRVSSEGWGARLLEFQDADGRWAGALYSPKWTSTPYTLLLLHWLGLTRATRKR